MFATLPAPADHGNVHVKDGNILAMQGEAMTTDAARKTPFNLLVAVDGSGNSYGEVFVDDGESVKMGQEGGNWSLVKFYSDKTGDGLYIRSYVVNGWFATSQKWVIDKVTILGLKKGIHVEGCQHHSKRGSELTGNPVEVASSSNNSGEFTVVELANFTIPLGKDFELVVKLA
ncbi:hypothetical protein MLD38_021229 [Melastoma candidum]|nr:hypothetical protein MLD38_021229 [Melastoma candidum]